MALPLSKATRLKPEIRLAQALSEYEAVLADDQKSKLRGYRAQSPPSASDVMRLTAEIDQDAVRNRKSRQCVGPRLSNVLQAAQRFTAVVDVAVGGSQCPIASGIWAVLKLSLQVLLHGSEGPTRPCICSLECSGGILLLVLLRSTVNAVHEYRPLVPTKSGIYVIVSSFAETPGSPL